MPTKIVDLFAGPGGLGEGFSALSDGNAFKIVVSAAMDVAAHETLRLRSFFRLVRGNTSSEASYYSFCNGTGPFAWDTLTESAWKEAGQEARQMTLGEERSNAELDGVLNQVLKRKDQWVLIGGPPCQAYSIVGRSRNVGTRGYLAENDNRHFLYRQYLRIIQERRPAVFVLENVKGILSSQVGGRRIFDDILRDLSEPDGPFEYRKERPGYRIHSLVNDTYYEKGIDPDSIDPRDCIVKVEELGLPQARHRVILLGVRNDIDPTFTRLRRAEFSTSVRSVIGDLPKLRSQLSGGSGTSLEWANEVRNHLLDLSEDAF